MDWKSRVKSTGKCPNCGQECPPGKAVNVVRAGQNVSIGLSIYKLQCCSTYFCTCCTPFDGRSNWSQNVLISSECPNCGRKRSLDSFSF